MGEKNLDQQTQTQQPATEPVVGSNQLSKAKKPWLKILLFLLLGIILIGGIGLTWLARQGDKKQTGQSSSSKQPAITEEEKTKPITLGGIEGWKEYVNEKDGYKLKYPPSFFIKENPEWSWSSISSLENDDLNKKLSEAVEKNDQSFWKDKLVILVWKYPLFDRTLEEWIKEMEFDGEIVSQESFQLGGQKALKEIRDDQVGGYSCKIFIEKENFVFYISTMGACNTYYKQVFDQILSSFRFLD